MQAEGRHESPLRHASTGIERSRGYDRRVDADREPVGDADLSAVGALLSEPARAKVLLALGDGRSLPASVLASEAGVAASTASYHLARLTDAGLIAPALRGRNRYYRLSGPRVAELIEAVARVAPSQPVTSLRQGTRAHAVRYARSCYDHLAGRLGVALTDALVACGALEARGDTAYAVTRSGVHLLADVGVATSAGEPVRGCLDWTEQRNHVAGPLGGALLERLVALGWLAREAKTRAVRLTDAGRTQLPLRLGVRLP